MDDTIENDYKAAGVLLFGEKGEVYMGVDKKGRLCDFGGKREDVDKGNPLNTATRECLEECGIVPSLSSQASVYLKKSKYHLYFSITNKIPIPTNEIKEIRTFDSIDSLDRNLNPRLWGNEWKKNVRYWFEQNSRTFLPIQPRRSSLRTVWKSAIVRV